MGAAILLILGIPIALVMLVGLIILQVFLAKKTSVLPGLILPVVLLVGAVAVSVIMVLFTGAARSIVVVFLLGGIPAVLLAGVLVVVRLVRKNNAAHKPATAENKELDRMNIQDLG